MNKTDFLFDISNRERDLMVVSIYNNAGIISMQKMNIMSVEEYDDEVTIRDDYNNFVVLNVKDVNKSIDDDLGEIIYTFGDNNFMIDVILFDNTMKN